MAARTSTAWSERATDELAKAGYRRGGARAAVVELLDSQGCALSAFEIEAALAASEGRSVGRASVYRVLEELERLRLVTRLDLGQGLARFEPARSDHHHHHMVCSECGRIFPFEDPRLERAIARVSRDVEFEVAEHDVTLRGFCRGCAAH